MPIARFEMPDGRVARFEVPEGTTPEQAQSMIQSEIPKVGAGDTAPVKMGKEAFPDTLREVLAGTDWGTRNIAGAGTALSNLWEGVKQFAGQEDQGKIASNRIIREEAPVGAIAGDIALTAAPFGLAGKSIPAAAGVGAGYGLTLPVEANNWQDVVKGKAINTGIGGATGAGGQWVANKASGWLADKATKLAADRSKNAPIDATIKEAIDAGYVIPPGQVKPSFMNRQLESVGGKIATQQMASSKNQVVTDDLARKAANLMPDEPITPDTLKAARDVLKQPYVEIANAGLQPKLDALDAARSEANAAWREYSRQGTRSALNDYKQFSTDAKTIEKEIETALFKANKPDLMKQFRDARVALAKNHDVESALIEGGGTVDARAIGRMFQRGDKMTGELETIGKFANNFKKNVQPESTMGTPDAHNLKWILSGALGAGGGMSDDPRYAALGLLPIVGSSAARTALFSKAAQSALANPSYNVPITSRMAGGLLGYSPIGGTVFGLNSFGQ